MTLCRKPSDMLLNADARANLLGLRSELATKRKQLAVTSDPELRRIIRKAIAVTQFDIRAIEKGNR